MKQYRSHSPVAAALFCCFGTRDLCGMVQQTLRLYRNAYQGLSPSVWLLAGVMLINRCGTMVLPFLTLYLTQHLHYSITEAGIVMALYGTGAFVGTFLGGRLTDRIGFYHTQLFSLLFAGFFLLGLQFVTNFYGLCVSVFLFTMLGDTFRPANSAAIAHYSDKTTRTRAYSLNRLAINLGWSIGGGLGGLIASVDYSLLFWIDGLTCIAAACVLWLFLPQPNRSDKSWEAEANQVAVARSPYRDYTFLAFAGCVLLFAMAFFLLFNLVSLYFKQELHLSEAQIGMLLSLNGLLIVLLEMALVYTIEQRWAGPKTRLISFGVMLTGLSYVVFLLGMWPGLALISTILTTFGEMFAMPFMQTFAVERSTPQNRGQYLALHSMAFAMSQVLSPALGSLVVQQAGFNALWIAAVGLCGLSASGFWWLGKRIEEPVVTDSLVRQ